MITYHGGICNNNTKIKISTAKLGYIDGNAVLPQQMRIYDFTANLSDEMPQISPIKHPKSLRRNATNLSDEKPQISPTRYLPDKIT